MDKRLYLMLSKKGMMKHLKKLKVFAERHVRERRKLQKNDAIEPLLE